MLSKRSINNKIVFYKIYLHAVVSSIKNKGWNWFLLRLLTRVARECGWLILLPAAMTLHLMGYRRVPIRVEHIGHLTTEIDTFLKAKRINRLSKKRYFILVDSKQISNPHMLSYWVGHVRIVSIRWQYQLLALLTHRYFMRDNQHIYKVGFFGTQPIYDINRRWDKSSSLLELTSEDEEWGNTALQQLGIPVGRWFVCFHVREGGFLPHNENIQSHRNASIEKTFEAMQEIIRRGGYVVRMGDSTMTPLPPMPGVIDYAHHPMKSDRLDVILCAKAKFFFGCTSGLAFLSMVFGVPIAHANMIPVETLGLRSCDLSIPKLLVDTKSGNYLTFSDAMSKAVSGFFFTHQYAEAGVRVEENTSDDILALTIEMLDRLDNNYQTNDQIEVLHECYMGYFKEGHYSFGAASRIGSAFLIKHQQLIHCDK